MILLQCALLFQNTIKVYLSVLNSHENVLALLKHGLLFHILYTFFYLFNI